MRYCGWDGKTPAEVEAEGRLKKLHKGKPIKKITTNDLGGPERHSLNRAGNYKRTDELDGLSEKTRERQRKIANFVSMHSPCPASLIVRALGVTPSEIGSAAARFGYASCVESVVAGGKKETVYYRRKIIN